ncbi:glutathione hydrolase 1 proenzyme-like [Haemaphysalis longicornis]
MERHRHLSDKLKVETPSKHGVGGEALAKDGATIGDIAVAMLFCLGVKIPYSTGIGGGFVAAYYSKGKVKVLDALGVSPAAITEDTFKNVTMENLIGPMSAIVPGAVMGYENLLRMTNSKVAWADLIKPAIDLATNGFPVDPKLAVYLRAIHPKKAADLL